MLSVPGQSQGLSPSRLRVFRGVSTADGEALGDSTAADVVAGGFALAPQEPGPVAVGASRGDGGPAVIGISINGIFC